MRFASLLLIGVSGITIAACSALEGPKKPSMDTPPPAASAAVSASATAQEAREMAAVMGEGQNTIDLSVQSEAVAGEAVANQTVDGDMMVAADANISAASAAHTPISSASAAHTPGVPDGCPIVEVLPDTRSITYFEEGATSALGKMTARASIQDIRGGCEYGENSVVVDIDMIMRGHITKEARYEGREDLEAFMTFPYFIAVMDANGNMIDKKIMATAMRFQPNMPDLDHAEKITQTIPLEDIGLGSRYTIATGFQLNRQQLDYNRGTSSKEVQASAKAKP